MDETQRVHRIKVDNGNKPYLLRAIGTWGSLMFPKHWRQFRLWMDASLQQGYRHPFIPGIGKSILRTSVWYAKTRNTVWTPWIVKFLLKKRLYGLLPNFKDDKLLSISHQEVGLNYGTTEGRHFRHYIIICFILLILF
jgi:hypothetical protein